MYVYLNVRTYVCMFVCVCVFYVCVCVYVCLCMCVYVFMYVCLCMCVYVSVCMCMYVCTCICMYTRIYGQAFCGFITQILLAYTLLLKFEYYEPDLSRESWNVICLQSHSQRRCPWPGIHPELKSSTRLNRHDRCGGRVNTCQRQMHIASHTALVLSALMNVSSFVKESFGYMTRNPKLCSSSNTEKHFEMYLLIIAAYD